MTGLRAARKRSIFDILLSAPDSKERRYARYEIDRLTNDIMAVEQDALELDEVPRRPAELDDFLRDGDTLETLEDGRRQSWPIEGVKRRAPAKLEPAEIEAAIENAIETGIYWNRNEPDARGLPPSERCVG